MLRQLTGIGFALALVGTAHAQDQLTVNPNGKTSRAVRAEIYRAAEKVCASNADNFAPLDVTCVESTYAHAVFWLRSALRVQTASSGPAPRRLR